MGQQHPPFGAPPQYSPDGRFWWDGYQWVAVQPQSQYAAMVPMVAYPPQRTSGMAKGCIVSIGVALILFGLLLCLTLVGFIAGIICIAIGLALAVAGAVM
jgi:hypothetical protein